MQKIPPNKREELLKEARAEIAQVAKGLRINFKIPDDRDTDLVNVEFDGEDSAVFTRLLDDRFGIAPLAITNIHANRPYRGVVTDSGKVGFGLYLDIGLRDPRKTDALLSLNTLRGQTADGEKKSIKELIKKYCLHDYVPLHVRVINVDRDNERIWVELLDHQIERLRHYVSSPLKRMILTAASRPDMNRIVKESGIAHTIASITLMSLAAYEITWKLGTDLDIVAARVKPLCARYDVKFCAPQP